MINSGLKIKRQFESELIRIFFDVLWPDSDTFNGQKGKIDG